MSNKQNNIKEILTLFDKLSASLMSLISKLTKQKILSLESIISKLPMSHRSKIVSSFKVKKTNNVIRGK